MKFLISLLASLALTGATFAAEPGVGRASAPSEGVAPQAFEELYQLLRKNLPGVSEAELEQAAVKGLINQLYPLVSIVTNTVPTPGDASPSTNIGPHASVPLAATTVLEGSFAYFRFNQITEGADKEFSAALKRIASTNRLRGLVLDLRFAEGIDYGAAAALADPFLPPRQPMIDWGDGLKLSTTKTDPVHWPIAILINKQTREAAEAFAAILRRSDIGLLLGDNTAGQAFLTRDFTLARAAAPSGAATTLRIATTPVKIGAPSPAPIPRNGLAPDIKVEVSLAEERVFLQDAYRALPRPDRVASLNGATNQVASTPAGTNTARRQRRPLNEADLVRMQREGIDLESDFIPGRDAGPMRPPVITDPVLARAIDLLKALSLVQHSRTSER